MNIEIKGALPGERFLPFPEATYEDYYLISDQNRVYSLKTNKFLKVKVVDTPIGNCRRLVVYQRVLCFITHMRKQKTFTMSRLLAKAFMPHPDGEKFYEKHQVDHKDENSTNNTLSNLEWTTNSKNTKKSIDHKKFLKEAQIHGII